MKSKRRHQKAAALFVVMFLMLVPYSTLWAHALPSSQVALDFYEDHAAAELILPLDRLEIASGLPLTASPEEALTLYRTELEDYIRTHVRPAAEDSHPWQVQVSGMSLQLAEGAYDLLVGLTLTPPQNASADVFTLHYDVIVHEIITHSVLVSVRNDWNHAVFSGQPELLGTLRGDETSMPVDRSNGSWWTGFRSVVWLGMVHIAEGTDHLLFLLTLLLPAPLLARDRRWAGFGGVRHSLLRLAQVVTAFTLGHSITLVAGSLGWMHLSGQLVEVLIALSILVSAVHALRPLFPGREAFVAAGFGLLHGLAFATLIEEIGISPWRMAASILGFNLGIELMQLAVIAVTVPWLLLLSLTRAFPAVRLAGAWLAMAASVGWMVERITGQSNPVSSLLDAASGREYWLIPLLAAAALVALARHRHPGRWTRTP